MFRDISTERVFRDISHGESRDISHGEGLGIFPTERVFRDISHGEGV